MKHHRKIVLGGVSLTKSRTNRHNSEAAKKIMDDFDTIIKNSDFLKTAPFEWISIIFYYGLKDDIKPKYKPINNRYKDLPVSLELDSNKLNNTELDNLIDIYKKAVLNILIDIGNKYNLPIDALLLEYNQSP